MTLVRTKDRPARSRAPGTVLRDMRPSDLRRIENWYRDLEVFIARTAPHHLAVRLPAEYPSLYASKSLRSIRKNGGFVLIAEVGARPAGFLTGEILPLPPRIARMELRPNFQGYIGDLYLERWARRRGVGRRLIEEASRRFLALGCDNLQLGVAPSNLSARRFYERSGFQEVSLRLRKDLPPLAPSWEEVRRRRARAVRSLRKGLRPGARTR